MTTQNCLTRQKPKPTPKSHTMHIAFKALPHSNTPLNSTTTKMHSCHSFPCSLSKTKKRKKSLKSQLEAAQNTHALRLNSETKSSNKYAQRKSHTPKPRNSKTLTTQKVHGRPPTSDLENLKVSFTDRASTEHSCQSASFQQRSALRRPNSLKKMATED